MHQVSLETICLFKAFLFHCGPDNNAKSMVKHFIFLHKFAVITTRKENYFLKFEHMINAIFFSLANHIKITTPINGSNHHYHP